jgi:hypothetical protein
VAVSHDANGEATYSYGSGNVVYFQDATSYQRKVQMLQQKHPQIGGFAHWALGQEDPAIWNVIRGGTTSSPATPPPVVTPPPPAPSPAPPPPAPSPAPAPQQPARRHAVGH